MWIGLFYGRVAKLIEGQNCINVCLAVTVMSVSIASYRMAVSWGAKPELQRTAKYLQGKRYGRLHEKREVASSYIEQKGNYVSVLHDVLFTLFPEQSLLARFGHVATFH